jgi:REP-associated tyrosine transposase
VEQLSPNRKSKQVDDWLQVDWLLSCFGKRMRWAAEQYKEFVAVGNNQPSPMEKLKNQIYLGSDEFVEEVQGWLEDDRSLEEIPSAQKCPVAKPQSFYRELHPARNVAMAKAYLSGGYSMREIGEFFGVHYMTVSRAVHWFEIHNVRC